MVRASCGVNSENYKQMMETSALDQAVDQIAKSNGMQLFVHMLRKEDSHAEKVIVL